MCMSIVQVVKYLGEKLAEKQESTLAEAARAGGGTKEEKGNDEEEGSSSITWSLIAIRQTSEIPTSCIGRK